LEKPDGLVIITAENKDEILLNLPLGEYCGIGQRIHKRLGTLGIYDTKGLREFPNVLLNKEFGIATGEKLKRMSFGLDNSPVKSWHDQPPAKSFSCSRTMNRDITGKNEIEKQILFLLEKVTKKMRDEGYWGKEAGLWLRFKDFSGAGKSIRIGKWSQDSLEINKTCLKILKTLKIASPVRAIGVYVGQVQLAKNVPRSILTEDKMNEKILAAMDEVNNRFGEDVITRARLAGTKLKEVVSGMGRKKF
jgi:DNA polymerase-4